MKKTRNLVAEMKLITSLFIIIALLISASSCAYQDKFNVLIRHATGDLNNDGLIDKVVIEMDTISETRPLRLQVFFAKANGKFKLKASTTNLIEPEYPHHLNGKHNGHTIPDIEIVDGKLLLETYFKGITVYAFKYIGKRFRLIEYSNVFWDGKETTTETKTDLINGSKLSRSQKLGSDEYFDSTEVELFIKVLPKIENFTTYEIKD